MTVPYYDSRFEFRIWGRQVEWPGARLRDLAPCLEVRESDELYIVAPGHEDHNVKLRHGTLDIKALIGRRDGLEHWRPVFRMAFPIAAEVLAEEALPLVGLGSDLAGPALARGAYSQERFLAEVVRPQPGLILAKVAKRRLMFLIEACRAELAEVRIDGRAIESLAVESPNAAAVLRVTAGLGLEGLENVSYPRAIERVLGRVPGRESWPEETAAT